MRGTTYVRGRGTIVGPPTVSVATAKGGQRAPRDYLIPPTGSFPTRLPGGALAGRRPLASAVCRGLGGTPKALPAGMTVTVAATN